MYKTVQAFKDQQEKKYHFIQWSKYGPVLD